MGQNATDYSLQYPDNLTIQKGTEAKFLLKIELKKTEKNNSVKETAPATDRDPTSEKNFEKMLEQMDSSHATVSENRQNQTDPTPTKQPELKTNAQVTSGGNPMNDAASASYFLAFVVSRLFCFLPFDM